MAIISEANRRTFLKAAGLTAIAGATGSANLVFASPNGSLRSADGKFDFDTVYNRIGTDCYKWDDQIDRFGAENIQVGMGVATMDFQAPPCIAEALTRRLSHENWGYPIIQDSFYESIVDWNKNRHGLEVDPDTIVISAGVYPGIIAAIRTFCEPASKVILLTPNYSGFYYHITHTRTVASESPMIFKDGTYEIDWDDLESHMTADAQAMIICNPQNPTGNVWSEDDLLRIGRMCLEHQVVVLSDEIHCDFVRGKSAYTPFAALPDKDVVDNSITFKAISKTFSLAALKNAYFFSTKPVLLGRIKLNHRADINVLGIVATEAAYRHGAEWFDQLLPYIDDNHSYIEQYIDENIPLVSYTRAQGTYLSWLDVSKVIDAIGAEAAVQKRNGVDYPVTAEEYVERWLVEHAGVQLNPGSNYGMRADGHMRMNLGTSRKLIKIALDNINSALQKV